MFPDLTHYFLGETYISYVQKQTKIKMNEVDSPKLGRGGGRRRPHSFQVVGARCPPPHYPSGSRVPDDKGPLAENQITDGRYLIKLTDQKSFDTTHLIARGRGASKGERGPWDLKTQKNTQNTTIQTDLRDSSVKLNYVISNFAECLKTFCYVGGPRKLPA